ncbi:MAG TPA: DUF5672 family protein [Puia sp.]|nr:DUF5672 family protein [Puia sp.]
MKKIFLDNVTLVGIDCIDIEALSAASEFCQKFIQFGQVKLLSHLDCDDPNLIKIDHINSHEAYNFFVMKKLYKYIDTEYLLIFQTDGFILNPFAWSDEFLQYDYIGAPWWYGDDCNVGNGGFSLRTRRIMEAIALDDIITDCRVEDHSICRTYGRYLKAKGFTFSPDDVARKFSVEQEKWNMQFGFHDTDISDWDICAYADKIKHAKYIDQFNKFYEKEAKDPLIS